MKLPATLRALQYRNFQLFFAGQLISLIGTWMQNVAEAWLVYRLTGSSVLLGAMGFATQIPIFVLSPVAGIVADRFHRRSVVMVTQAISMVLAAALAVITLTGTVKVWQLFAIALARGVVNAFDIPARQAFIVQMVDRHDLMNAIALNSSMFNASRVIGPAVAGIMVAAIGEGWCFFANAVSYIAVLVGLFLMRVERHAVEADPGSPLTRIAEGFRFVLHNLPVCALLVLVGVISLTSTPLVLMPIFADRILHGGARGLGVLMAISGVGALGGALLLASRRDLKGLTRWVAIAATACGASMVLFSLSRVFWLSGAILVPLGFSMMVQMGSSNTLVQSMAPDRLRGRVMSVYSMMLMGMAPFGALLAGAAADWIGAPETVAAGGLLCLAAAGVYWFFLPKIRAGARQLVVAQQVAVAEPAVQMAGGSVAIKPSRD